MAAIDGSCVAIIDCTCAGVMPIACQQRDEFRSVGLHAAEALQVRLERREVLGAHHRRHRAERHEHVVVVPVVATWSGCMIGWKPFIIRSPALALLGSDRATGAMTSTSPIASTPHSTL